MNGKDYQDLLVFMAIAGELSFRGAARRGGWA
ncbi:hypothetical protein SAMN05428963_11746 [Consotaella salsifontis]|uniref:Uncharacterized protein n=1 Tax=Consotaella salsifontis TaxID=1365950 RepID=A0A1T4T234_9HYPH|nr:hypothetical protein SAMN05428963_11746 [Consotaella salsifontis]